MDVAYDWNKLPVPKSLKDFEAKWLLRHEPLPFSGVWRFYELLPFAPQASVLTIGEGQTLLRQSDHVAQYVGVNNGNLFLQYEGMNPSGSFKDNGMTAAFTHAHMTGAKRAACASTGNTSASLSLYCSATGLMRGIVFIGSGKISYGKLAQALDHGALTIQIAGDFDDAMQRVQQIAKNEHLPRQQHQPVQARGPENRNVSCARSSTMGIPDWIVVPGGNLGNSSAFGKAFIELKHLGLISKIPRLAVINAAGANTFNLLTNTNSVSWNQGEPNKPVMNQFFTDMDTENRRASTIASAIEINRPVNLVKGLRAIEFCNGIVRETNDQEIMDAKAKVGAGGMGCEPASAASVAGAKKLRAEGIIAPSDRVVCILTAHQMKDSTATVAYHSSDQKTFDEVLGVRGVRRAGFANRAIQVPNSLDDIIKAIEVYA